MERALRAIPILFLCLSSCISGSPQVTSSEATFLSVTPHEILVQMDSSGAFMTSRSLPLGNSVRVIVEGKPATLAKLRAGQRIRISRDAQTHQVVAIEAI